MQRPPDAKLLLVDACGRTRHVTRSAWVEFLRSGDLVVANDAATLPASLHGIHRRTGESVEIRLAGRPSLGHDVTRFSAIVFGAGDFHTRTEDRPAPPALVAGDRFTLGPLSALVEGTLGHPRLVSLRFEDVPEAVWSGLAHHGRPIQYAHLPLPLALWDVWAPIAAAPVAFEPPSAGFALNWRAVERMNQRGIAFATLTHAAGVSSTGDRELDARLPFDEPYQISEATALAVRRAQAHDRRIVAIGTTVVRALESAALRDGRVLAGPGLATERIGATSRLRIVHAILSGTHEPGTAHYELLRAFTDDATLLRVNDELQTLGYRTHEFGDSVLIERKGGRAPSQKHATICLHGPLSSSSTCSSCSASSFASFCTSK